MLLLGECHRRCHPSFRGPQWLCLQLQDVRFGTRPCRCWASVTGAQALARIHVHPSRKQGQCPNHNLLRMHATHSRGLSAAAWPAVGDAPTCNLHTLRRRRRLHDAQRQPLLVLRDRQDAWVGPARRVSVVFISFLNTISGSSGWLAASSQVLALDLPDE